MKKEIKQEMIYGIHPVIEAINSDKEVEKVLVQKGLQSSTLKELMALLKERDVPYQFVPPEKINRVSRKNHQGVIAFVSPIHFFNIENLMPGIYEQGREPFILVLDRITDVRNFGAVLRTAECSGVDAVVIPSKNTAQLNSDTIKSSAGAIFKVPVCRSDNLKTTLDFLKNSGLKVVASTEKSESTLFDTKLTGPLAIIMGSEGDGVSEEYLKRSDLKVKIPILGEIESLNVSVATGVILYEVVRQRAL
ncbi:MAG: 23S rRNA (guanosine(2251)-2'-O)-methyltransferase RlmB [Bacteroidetes bacterium]|nr:MAG: 23S rRNA (guanosine(2251)-2'-O)-methyltransferase RlmB [Bacteroidota bacterium]